MFCTAGLHPSWGLNTAQNVSSGERLFVCAGVYNFFGRQPLRGVAESSVPACVFVTFCFVVRVMIYNSLGSH